MKRPRLAILLILVGLSACARPNDPPRISSNSADADVLLTSVPFHPQAERDDCGPAALAMMLGWSGIETDPAKTAPIVYTPGRHGTLQTDIVQAGRRSGRLVAPVGSFEDLLAELDAGNPVLVLQNLGFERWPLWHYAVVIGYDLKRETIFLHSGKTARLEMDFRQFDATWRSRNRWALTITRPEHLPKTLDRKTGLKAANGLEQAGRHDAAGKVYGALLDQWPDDLTALMGFGNARYAASDVDSAQKTFRHAVTLHPDAAEAWNNLAVTLGEQGEHGGAVHAVNQAIRLGGPHKTAALQTLAELEADFR